MLLFSRVLTLGGHPRKAMEWAVTMNTFVNEHSDLDVTLWAAQFGSPLGTVAFTAVVESQAALAEAAAGLEADDAYFEHIEAGQPFSTAPGMDTLSEFVYGDPPAEAPPIGSVSTVTAGVAPVDQIVEAVAWGVDIAQYISGAVAPVHVLTGVFGQMGQISWIGIQPDIASAEAARLKMMTDPGYLDRMPAVKELFIPGTGRTSQLVRIA